MKSKRQDEILKLLLLERSLKTDHLAAYFDVSIETIRRDIHQLVEDGLIEKVYGGIRLHSNHEDKLTYNNWQLRLMSCPEEKDLIATKALSLVKDGATIALDYGTTTFKLAQLLSSKSYLTIITNSMKISNEISKNPTNRTFLCGGLVVNDEMITAGSFSKNFLQNFASVDYFFSGADGITLSAGIMDTFEGVVEIKRYLNDIATCTVGLIDYTKFNKKETFHCFPIERMHILITDNNAPKKMLESITRVGTQVIIAEP